MNITENKNLWFQSKGDHHGQTDVFGKALCKELA